MKAAFYTFGCKVNQYETQGLIDAFSAAGFDICPVDEACEVYVVNSCTVTAEGDAKVRKLMRRLRREHPGALLALTGCYAQAFEDIAALVPEADVITGSKDRPALLPAVQRALSQGERVVEVSPHAAGEPFEALGARSFLDHEARRRTRAFVKIQDGCERFCAYCIIPRARGPLRSRSLGDLETELRVLRESGYREVVLVGINLSCYGVDNGSSLQEAAALCCRFFERVRLSSLEPELLGEETVAALAALPGLCPSFHLSLQSGCDATLRRMRRHYDAAEYAQIAQRLRRAFPGCAVTTDVMVGFPGETEEEFGESLRFCRQIGFAKVHVFSYSRRPGTAADTMPGQVDEAVKALRSRRMIEAMEESRRLFLAAQEGQICRVLLEREDGRFSGYSENYTPVLVRSPAVKSGEILAVRLTGVEGGVCVGEALGAPEIIC